MRRFMRPVAPARPHHSLTRTPAPGDRRGVTLVVVLAILAACVVISISFLQAEATLLQVARNADAEDRARRAAECGMAAALSDLQSPTWAGIGTVLQAEVGRDGAGVCSYRAVSASVVSDGTISPVDAAMRVKLTSVGTFLPTGNPRPVERTIEAVLQLVPRVPTSLSATPSDRKPDAAFDPVQTYAVLADTAGDSLRLPPQARIVGDVWCRDNAKVYSSVNWPGPVRDRAGADRPQPITGMLTIYQNQVATDAANLTAILGSTKWQQTTTLRTLPFVNPTDYSPSTSYVPYEVFSGGADYRAVAVGGTLDGTPSSPLVLGPTDTNPLGIYYRSGNLVLEDNVRITGTLVTTGSVTFNGPGIELAPVRPGTGSGTAGSGGATVSLPALIAGGTVDIKKEATVTINGVLYSQSKVTREAVDRHAGTTVTVNGAILCGNLQLETPPMWQALSTSNWTNRDIACPTGTPFFPWLANAANWPLLSWPLSYSTYGLSNEPTFTVTRPTDALFALRPPLYRPDPSPWNAGGGYRWQIIRWSEAL